MIKRISNFFASIFSIIVGIYAIIEVLSYFNVCDLSIFGLKGFFAIVTFAVVSIVINLLLNNLQKDSTAKETIKQINDSVDNRQGVKYSSRKPTKYEIDSIHSIALFERSDILDYNTPDYFSYRRIRGKNEKKVDSPFLKYKESTDSRTSPKDLVIEAFDLKTGKSLRVKFDRPETKGYSHSFKIYFTIPLEKGEEFDIAYIIKIPGELSQLGDDDEIMSVTLNRYKKKISMLRFNIYLSFSPTHAEAFLRTSDKKARSIPEKPQILSVDTIDMNKIFQKYTAGTVVDSMIKLEVNKPLKETYVISYKK